MPVRTRLFAHLETCRPYTACYVGLVGLAGAALTDPHAGAGALLAAWAVPTLGWIAGLYGGDFFDRELDAAAKPHRPIPSGRLSPRTAFAVFVGAVVIGAVVSLALNWRTVLLVAAACAGGVGYSLVLKGRGLSGNLARGALTAFAFLYGAMMVSDLPPLAVAPLALVFWLHDAGSNLIGAVRDVDGDAEGGYETFAVTHGRDAATRLAALLLAAAYALTLAAPLLLDRPAASAPVLVLAAVSATWALAPVLRDADRRTAYTAHTVLVFTRILLAGAFLARSLPAVVAVPVVVAALAATAVSQRALRERHEFAATDDDSVTAGTVVAFVDAKLAELGERPAPQGWTRLIDVRLTDPEVHVRLHAVDGRITRLPDDAPDPDATAVSITTSGRVFADIFLRGRSNPRRAYLLRQLTMTASASDMMRLNQLFNAFRTRTGAVVVSEPAPVADSALGEGVVGTVVISDTTLRDGEQMPGVVFPPAAKVSLARRLADAGVPLVEAGFPAVSEEEAGAIRAIVDDYERHGTDAVVQVIARPVDRDIDAAIGTGAQSIAIFVGTSESHLRTKLRLTEDEVALKIDRAVRRAKAAGRQVVFAAEDATRSDLDVLLRLCGVAADAGADTLGLADTVGIAHPASMARLVRDVAAACPLPIAVHCHNDLGLATANSVAAVLAGASGVQCSLLGIGERAGNAPLEQVALALHAALGHDTGLDLAALGPLARDVAVLAHVDVPPYQPVAGANAFTHESGLHLDGITQDPATYEPYPPELVGRERRLVLGKHSGASAVRAVARSAGIELSEQRARAVLAAVKGIAEAGGLDPSDDAAALVARYAASPAPVLVPDRSS